MCIVRMYMHVVYMLVYMHELCLLKLSSPLFDNIC